MDGRTERQTGRGEPVRIFTHLLTMSYLDDIIISDNKIAHLLRIPNYNHTCTFIVLFFYQ